jgi:hypothetical protein
MIPVKNAAPITMKATKNHVRASPSSKFQNASHAKLIGMKATAIPTRTHAKYPIEISVGGAFLSTAAVTDVLCRRIAPKPTVPLEVTKRPCDRPRLIRVPCS